MTCKCNKIIEKQSKSQSNVVKISVNYRQALCVCANKFINNTRPRAKSLTGALFLLLHS